MDEQLKQKLSESATNIIESIEKGIDWTTGQAPIVAQEYLKLYIFGAWFDLVLALLLSILAFFICGFCYKHLKKKYKENEEKGYYKGYNCEGYQFTTIACFIILFATLFWFAPSSITKIYKGYNAPRIVVLEGIKGLF